MSDDTVRIEFADGSFAPLDLPRGAVLSEHLDVRNSPVLFGCRTGICGSCVARIDVLCGEVPARSEDEVAVIELVAPGEVGARLTCQLTACADLRIARIDS